MFSSDYEINVIDEILHERITSPQMMAAIQETIRSSFKETVQKSQINVSQITENVVRTFKEDLKDSLVKSVNDWVNAQNGLLEVVPQGTRLLKQIGNYKLIVVEYPPQTRVVHFANENTPGGSNGDFKLAFPYIVFLITINTEHNRFSCAKVRVAFSKKPLESLDSIVYPPNLPNIGENFVVCMGGSWTHLEENNVVRKSLSGIVEDVVTYFWNSRFNNDINQLFISGTSIDPKLSNLHRWEAASGADPLFMLKIDWRGGKHLRNLISDEVSGDLKIQVGPIVDRAVNLAGTQLTQYFNNISVNNNPSQKIISMFRTRLYDSLFKVCQELIGKVREHERDRLRQELKEELAVHAETRVEPKVEKLARYESGDYMYKPPQFGIW